MPDPGPRAFPRPLIPIFIPQKHPLQGVLALQAGEVAAGPGRAPGPVLLRTGPLTSPVLSQWVQCVTEGEAGATSLQEPVLSRGPAAPGPHPVSALRLPRASPRAGQRPQRVWPQARWAGGAARRERRGSAPKGALCRTASRRPGQAAAGSSGSPEPQGAGAGLTPC